MKAYGTVRFENMTCKYGCCFGPTCAAKYHTVVRKKSMRKAIKRYHRGKARSAAREECRKFKMLI